MQPTPMQESSLINARKPRWIVVVAIALGVGSAGIGLWRFQTLSSAPPQAIPVSEPVIKTVTALGRLAPRGEVIKLSAPTLLWS